MNSPDLKEISLRFLETVLKYVSRIFIGHF